MLVRCGRKSGRFKFLWCAAKNALPTKHNLEAWHIPVGNVCDGCGDHSESMLHALWLCDQVRSVWMSDLGFLFLVQAKCRSFMELLEVLFTPGTGFRIELFAAWRGVCGSTAIG